MVGAFHLGLPIQLAAFVGAAGAGLVFVRPIAIRHLKRGDLMIFRWQGSKYITKPVHRSRGLAKNKNAFSRANLGEMYRLAGRLDDAISEGRRAVRALNEHRKQHNC